MRWEELQESLEPANMIISYAEMRVSSPEDVCDPAKAMWSAVATFGPWTSGLVCRYHAHMAVAAACEALAEAIRVACGVKHGWEAPR